MDRTNKAAEAAAWHGAVAGLVAGLMLAGIAVLVPTLWLQRVLPRRRKNLTERLRAAGY